ncbi:MAG: hypothetical protein WKF70_00060 [Chitinophagaceae bacterium]
MTGSFVLPYSFLNSDHAAFVESRKTKKGIFYYVTPLTDDLFNILRKKIVFSADLLTTEHPHNSRNIIDVIQMALAKEVRLGLYR